jgi:alpha-tubulin suppressor-like RCC1 family protein
MESILKRVSLAIGGSNPQGDLIHTRRPVQRRSDSSHGCAGGAESSVSVAGPGRPFRRTSASGRFGGRRVLPLLLLSAVALAGCGETPVELVEAPQAAGPLFSLLGPAGAVDAGYGHICAVGADGKVSCWGNNFYGQATVPATLGSATQVSAGQDHTCAIESDGAVVCWGYNGFGQTTVPVTLGSATQVSAGQYHTCAIESDGAVVCWGNNGSGQTTVPTTLGSATQVSAGGSHTCALESDGGVVCWGNNGSGQTTVPATLGSATQVSAAGAHTCALESDGGVVCWGYNGQGQTSVPATLGSATQVSVGEFHTCALESDGGIVCWGYNGQGQTSVPATLGSATQVSADTRHTCALESDGGVVCWGDGLADGLVEGSFSDVSPGADHTCALRSDGGVVCWGHDGGFGRTIVPATLGSATQVSAGRYHTCALESGGGVVCWGYDGSGQTTVPATLGSATQVSAAGAHTCALKSDGGVACWGYDGTGQTTVPATLGSATQVSAGGSHTCAIESDSGVVCWGHNGFGQTTVPATLGSATQVSTGQNHTCALESDGGVVCWGDNGFGQTTVPATLGSATQVRAGSVHTCAIESDGSVVCWGHNGFGQTTVPPDLGPAIQLGAGVAQSCAVKADNTIECWGNRTSTTFIPEGAPGATPVGPDVTVSPVDQTTGEPAPVELTFDNVTGGGETTVTSGTVGQGGGPPAPGGFRLGNPPTYYDVQTTATFTGSATLCFNYSGADYGNENILKLLHNENGLWVDVTTSLDTINDIICGTVTSLSPFLVAEQNVAPVVTGIGLPSALIPVGTGMTMTASFTDANPGDTHTAEVDWEDATTSAAGVTESGGAGSVVASHTYAMTGVYTITARVTDGDLEGTRSSSDDQPAFVVVYDPSAGFVTGGGWFESPSGACTWSGCAADGSTIGKATFGFVSRYRKGAHTPSGNTEFRFEAGDLTFRSTTYQWLVVAGARAQFRGEGSIGDATGTFGFLITAIDGARPGGGGADRFRMKIWDVSTGVVVYDNQVGQLEDSPAATLLGGGSIVIHE